MSESTPPHVPESSGQIGVDQWVAQSDERREQPTGLRGLVAIGWGKMPPAGKLALPADKPDAPAPAERSR